MVSQRTIRKKATKRREIKPFYERHFLNLPSKDSPAVIKGRVPSGKYRHDQYELVISDCDGEITLHGRLDNKVSIENFRHKIGLVKSVCDNMLKHVEAELLEIEADFKESKKLNT
jgi:hypothetical protein